MKIIPTILATVAGAALPCGPAQAMGEYPAIALDISQAQTSPCASSGVTRSTIRSYTPLLSTPDGPFFFVYVLSCNGWDDQGVSGFECGIDYPGGVSAIGGQFPINVFSWHLCADEEARAGWPASGGSNRITWLPGNCQQTRSEPIDPQSVIAVGGYFYLAAYVPSEIWLNARSDTPHTSLFACDGTSIDLEGNIPSAFGVAGFGGYNGYNPCAFIVPTRQTTWGDLKTLHR